MPNRLAQETSPYLLQHKNNPVEWYPWSQEALEKAKAEDKPIFLSIGYSACHWCHVMEHESFEDADIAEFLNQHFVSIKVDREERPDLDHIYMQTVMALRGGQGGWPLSAFLTPKGEVFFGGTYWPPRARVGMPGFDSVIRQVHQAYRENREAIEDQASRTTSWLEESIQTTVDTESQSISAEILQNAAMQLMKSFDFENGGFGSAPKFPHPMDLQLLLRLATHLEMPDGPSREQMLEMVELNLNKMAYGGIHDHLGGGFCRYSVDAKWLVPHFEKMLYDNAQLLRVYREAALATGKESHRRNAEKTANYLQVEMLDESGGFHSSEDADSEGVEGKFYVWTQEEVKQILGESVGKTFCQLYDVTPGGNFEGKNILNLPVNYKDFAEQHQIDKSTLRDQMRDARKQLLEVRNQRIRPGRDDKILTSWNALAIDAFAFSQPNDPSAKKTIEFLQSHMLTEDGRLKHSYRHGQVKIDAFLDDYAYCINALVTASQYSVPFRSDWIDLAVSLADKMIELFIDQKNGGFYFTPVDQEDLIARYKDHHDGSIPSGNGMAAYALLRLARMTGNPKWRQVAVETIQWAIPFVQRSPLACGQMLLAIDLFLAPSQEILLLLPDSQNPGDLEICLSDYWLPYASTICATENELDRCQSLMPEVLAGKKVIDDRPTLYLCEGFACQAPTTDLALMKTRLNELSESGSPH